MRQIALHAQEAHIFQYLLHQPWIDTASLAIQKPCILALLANVSRNVEMDSIMESMNAMMETLMIMMAAVLCAQLRRAGLAVVET